MATVSLLGPIQLTWNQQNRNVVFTPQDEDRFVLSVGEAIDACRAHAHEKKFRLQFRVLLNLLGNWVETHRQKIEEAIITRQEDSILFLVIRADRGYDRDFEDELTDLDMAVAQAPQLDLIHLTVLALPRCSDAARNGFVNPELFLVYEGYQHS